MVGRTSSAAKCAFPSPPPVPSFIYIYITRNNKTNKNTQVLEGGNLDTQLAGLSWSRSYSNGFVPMSWKTALTLCFRDLFLEKDDGCCCCSTGLVLSSYEYVLLVAASEKVEAAYALVLLLLGMLTGAKVCRVLLVACIGGWVNGCL